MRTITASNSISVNAHTVLERKIVTATGFAACIFRRNLRLAAKLASPD